MKYTIGIIVILLIAIAVLWNWNRKPSVVTIETIKLDTAYRSAKNEEIKSLQHRIDSIITLNKAVHTYPTRKLDSIVHIISVVKDSLRCVDEATYRDLVINHMNFGEDKYSICLGQLALKDTIIQSFKHDLTMTIEKRREVSLQLQDVRHKQYHWLVAGVLLGVGASLAIMYAR